MNNPFKYRIPICTTTLGNFNWSRLIQNCFRAQVRQQLNEWHKFKRLQMCTVLSFRSGLKTICTTQLFLMKLHFGRKKVQYTIIDGYLCKMSTFLNVYKLLILYCIVILLICVPSAL